MVKQHPRLFSTLLVVNDLIMVLVAGIVAFWIRFYSGWIPVKAVADPNPYLIVLTLAAPLTLIFFSLFGVYEPRRTASIFSDTIPILLSSAATVGAISAFTFFYREVSFSRLTFLLFGGILFLLSGTERIFLRWLIRYLRKRGFNVKRLLVVGAGELGLRVVQAVRNHPEYGYKIIGMLDDYISNGYFKKDHGVEVLGRIRELPELVAKYDVDKVIIALPVRAYDKIRRIVEKCEYEGIEAEIVPDFLKIIRPKTQVKDFDGLPLVSIRSLPTESWGYTVAKRAFDIAFSLTVLILGAPVFVLIAIGVKLSSPGPVFFTQERIGAKRKPFTMYKFRTMRVAPKEESDVTWTTQNDNRRTWFGAFLRKTSLDELPQFWNVLKGDMSVVGPRPERPYFAEQFKDQIPKYMVRHQVKTGITGWAQVNGWRGDTSIQKRLECDLYYLENWSFWFDLKIIFLTIFKGLVNRNAY